MLRFHLHILIILLLSGMAFACEVCDRKPIQRTPMGPVVEYDLTIAEQTLSPAGKPVRALTVNGGIPGPVLRFREGDWASIRVHNALPHESTSVHWHGILLPNDQDGVPHLTTPPIKAGTTFTYEFPIRQSGTYWYHSHTGVQEQGGVYGSLVIAPRGCETVRADREHVLVLSDWTNERPAEVMRTLMRMGGPELYALQKGTVQSVAGAIRSGKLRDYVKREKSRLPAMEYSDVAYDAFLANGQRSTVLEGKPGETIRLRVINASASTYFYVESAAGPLTIVAADGPPVKPIKVRRLLMGIAETYDVLVKLPASGRWEFRATAQDGSGITSAWLGSGEQHPAPDVPKPDTYGMAAALVTVLDELDESASLTDAQALAEEKPRPLSPYRRLEALHSTEFSALKPRRTIQLKLTGDMMRYLWTINGKTLAEDSTIKIHRGEVVRLDITNNTMMHHPVHLHGHFFRVVLDKGARSPLKHTLDLPPMSRRTVEFDATESGDWMFHCHVLYHMMSGMARVFSYDDQPPAHKVGLDPVHLNPWHFSAEASIESQMTMGMATLMNSRNNINLDWEIGYKHMEMGMDSLGNMISRSVHKPDYEINLTYSRYLSPHWDVFAGYRFTNWMDGKSTAIVGADYLLPLNVMSKLSVDGRGAFRAELGKTFQITDRLGVFGMVRFDTWQQWMWMSGATWTLNKRLSLTAHYDSDYGFGGGAVLRF
jgi:FtsP/CotA-like multicopper oxidase with cupredoxin domain